MSCEGSHNRYLDSLCSTPAFVATFGSSDMAKEVLEEVFRVAKEQASQTRLNAKTKQYVETCVRTLFARIQAAGLKPPTHSKSGLPKRDSQIAYTSLFELIHTVEKDGSLTKLGARVFAHKQKALDDANRPAHVQAADAAFMEAATELDSDEDLINNTAMAELFSKLATSFAGEPRNVIFGEPGSGFATDMQGSIYLDPRPLEPPATVQDNIIVVEAGAYHELGHEKYTRRDIWARVLELHGNKRYGIDEEGLNQFGRAMLPEVFNIVEDGRMERCLANEYLGIAETLALSCQLQPRWDEHVGPKVQRVRQVMGAMLYTALPYFAVREEVREVMGDEARTLFETVEPLVQQAVHASPEDSFERVLAICKVLQHDPSMTERHDLQDKLSIPKPPEGTQPYQRQPQQQGQQDNEQQGQDQGSEGQQDDPQQGQGRGSSGSQQDDPQQGQRRGGSRAQQDDPQQRQGRSSGSQQDDQPQGQGRLGGQQDDPQQGQGQGSRGQQDDQPSQRQGRGSSGQQDDQPSQRQGRGSGGQKDDPQQGQGRLGGQQQDQQQGQAQGRSGSGEQEDEAQGQGRGSSAQQDDQQAQGRQADQDDQQGSGRAGVGQQDDEQQGSGRASAGQQEEQQGSGRASAGQQDDQHGQDRQAAQDDPQSSGRAGAGEQDDQQQSQGRGSAYQQGDQQGSGQAGQQDDPQGEGQGRGTGCEYDAQAAQPSGGAGGAGGKQSDVPRFSQEQLDNARTRVLHEAAAALQNGVRRLNSPTAIGRNLHKPLANARSVNQRFRAGGKRHSVTVLAPTVDPIADQELLDDLAKREPQIKEVAKKLGKQLKSIRGDIEQRQSHLKEGQIDRRRFVAAVKGASDVYSNTQQSTETQFASSLVIDLSGSMYREVSSGSLYDATRILGETFDDLEMRYEVRGFGSSELVFKNMGDSTFAPERAAILAKSTFGGTLMADSAGLATNALRACEEKNRFMTILSDGDAADHDLAVQRLKEARESGVLTFGIYLSSDPIGGGTRDKLNALYGGEGNWTQIWSVRELPNTVGKRLATLFKRMKK